MFGGGYEAYLVEREVSRRHARDAYEEYADRRSGLEDRGRMQRAWLDAGLRKAAGRQRDNDKIGRGFRVEQTEKQAAKARQTDRMIERLPEVPEPRKEWELQYSIQAAPRSGSVVAVARAAVVRRGSLHPGAGQPAGGRRGPDRCHRPERRWEVDVAGPAARPVGTGRGRGLRWVRGVAVGEVDQARGLLVGPDTLLRTFADVVPDWPESEIRTLLAKFGLRPSTCCGRPSRSRRGNVRGRHWHCCRPVG